MTVPACPKRSGANPCIHTQIISIPAKRSKRLGLLTGIKLDSGKFILKVRQIFRCNFMIASEQYQF
jgi:hypothetical protein